MPGGFTGNMAGQKIINLGTGTAATDATNKGQVDAALATRVTQTQLTTALANRVTTTQLTEALADKVTMAQVNAAIAAALGGGGGGLTAPAQAAAAGFTRLAFSEDFNDTSGIDMADSRQPGFNFYIHRPFGRPNQPTNLFSVANSVLTLQSLSGPNDGLHSTCGIGNNQWVGFGAAGGAYFEASLSMGPKPTGAPGWPSFWAMAAEHEWASGLQNSFVEVDFFEKIPDAGRYTIAMHQWTYPGPTHGAQTFHLPAPGAGSDTFFSAFHTYGTLWQPGNRYAHYRDDALVATNLHSANPWFAQGDDNTLDVILGGDGWPIKVDWVRVWQAPL
jgi:beta-glucanase (GH16 family)